jgi:hypothetical protein
MAAGMMGAAAAIAQAIKASGVIVQVEPQDFLLILQKQQAPLVVQASFRIFRTTYQYLSSYKGLAFFTKSTEPLVLPGGCEVVQAQRMWVP